MSAGEKYHSLKVGNDPLVLGVLSALYFAFLTLVFVQDLGVVPDDVTSGELVAIVGHHGGHVEYKSETKIIVRLRSDKLSTYFAASSSFSILQPVSGVWSISL